MKFQVIDMPPRAACAALRHSRKLLLARVGDLLNKPDDRFAADFQAMVAAVEAGFRHEEALLERLGDACLPPRRADHAILLSALHRTAGRVEDGDVRLGRQVAHGLHAVLSLPWAVAVPVSLHAHAHAGRRHGHGTEGRRHAIRHPLAP